MLKTDQTEQIGYSRANIYDVTKYDFCNKKHYQMLSLCKL